MASGLQYLEMTQVTKQLLCVFCGEWTWFTYEEKMTQTVGVCKKIECTWSVIDHEYFDEKWVIATECTAPWLLDRDRNS